ncbi:CLUMA_CG002116, isoform A [Clunio marinus]|uniref:CLUMA_CG002116, isoform A n=1 Tax=Clunio marinus TaxID=568069 RepID=A0A1J1HQ46_9DIPT|nr:CLUMA_CG002116, isoform A [Clunio marinus]
MKSVFVALFFVGLATAEFDNVNFIQRHKRDTPSTCEANIGSCCKDETNCEFDCSSLIIDGSSYNDFVKYSNDMIIRSFEYLFLSAQFGTHLKDRPGFEKILHGLADEAWNKGLDMIKESSKRGVSHTFKVANDERVSAHGDYNEVEALAKAVEIEKKLLVRANDIHRHHSHATLNDEKAKGYDAGIAHYLEEEIIEPKIDAVRNLVGHVNDLKNIFKKDSSIFPMSLYLFDQHLQK